MEWLFIPLAVIAALGWALRSGRRRRRGDDAAESARAHAEAERQKYDWYGGGR